MTDPLHNLLPTKAAARSQSNLRCRNPSAAAAAKIRGSGPVFRRRDLYAVLAPVVGREGAELPWSNPAMAQILPVVVVVWDGDLPHDCGGKNRPVGECNGYTYMSPALKCGYAPLVQRGGGDLCHFGGSHGFFQPGKPLAAEICPQCPE